MRYVWLGAMIGLLLAGCLSVEPTPTPAVDVPALQTEAAALRAVNDAQATLAARFITATPEPPSTQTAGAGAIATIWAGATVTSRALDVQSTQTISAIFTAGAADRATTTALVQNADHILATLTALPTP